MEAATPLFKRTNINPMETSTVVCHEDNTLTITVKGLQTIQLNDRSEEPNPQTQEEDQYQKLFPKKIIMGLSISLLVVGILSMMIQVPDIFNRFTCIGGRFKS